MNCNSWFSLQLEWRKFNFNAFTGSLEHTRVQRIAIPSISIHIQSPLGICRGNWDFQLIHVILPVVQHKCRRILMMKWML